MSEPRQPFTLMDPAIHADPYPAYAWLREKAPLYRIDGTPPVYAISRQADVDRVMRDHQTFASDLGMHVPLMSMVMMDRPEHTRLRSTINKAFTPRAMQHLEPRIRALAADFASALVGRCEFVAAFANPLPVTVICELLGVPLSQRDRMNRYARDALLASFAATGMGSDELRAEAEQGLTALMDILDGAIQAHIERPRENIISALVRDEAAGLVSRTELRHLCALLLIAGHETTANLIANGAHHLSRHPQILRALKAEPGRIAQFVDELARMAPPLQRIMRRSTCATEIAGQPLPTGSLILVLPGSANRDVERWPDPDRFDLERNCRGHLGFGTGIHVCPGSALARLETRIAFEVLLDSVDDIRPDPERQALPIVGYGAGSLGWNSLPLIFDTP